MSFGYTGPLEVTENDLAIIGRFIHRCGHFEAAIDTFIKHYNLTQKLDQYKNKKGRKSSDDKIEVLKKFCHNVERGSLSDKEFERAKRIHSDIERYKRQNGVMDLRNTIANPPLLVSVMGAWQPGPG
jgi:hypothetical protein